MARKSRRYEYSAYQYQIWIEKPGRKRQYFSSYKDKSKAFGRAKWLSIPMLLRVIVIRRCDNRVFYDSFGLSVPRRVATQPLPAFREAA